MVKISSVDRKSKISYFKNKCHVREVIRFILSLFVTWAVKDKRVSV